MPSPVVALTASTSTPGAARRDVVAQMCGVGHEVGLGEHDQRRGSALPGEREEPLDPADVGFRVQALGDDRHVDVGRQYLAVRRPGRDRGAYEGRSSRQDCLGGNPRIRPCAHDDPVADARRGDRVAGTCLQERAGERRAQRAVGAERVAGAAVDARDPGRDLPVVLVGTEGRGMTVVPAEGRQVKARCPDGDGEWSDQ